MIKKDFNLIQFRYLLRPKGFKRQTLLKKFISTVLAESDKKVNSVIYIFCSDEYLLGLNKSFLNHNTYTDILTFELSEQSQPLLAEIYISVERVKSNSIELKQDFLFELHRIIFHGLLHLVGFMDKTARQKLDMTSMEDQMLKRYFVSRENNGTNFNTFPVKR